MGERKPRSKLIVALDVPTLEEAERWVILLKGRISLFKVGSVLFTAEGPSVVEMIRRQGGEVFLDLKFHDIPNTVAEACRVATRLGVSMLNLHIVSGKKVLQDAAKAVSEEASRQGLRKPYLLGVTLLTHLDKTSLSHFGWDLEGEMKEEVIHLATLAKEDGLDGVVCSPQEIRPVREALGKEFLIVTPGIRPAGSNLHDQKRVSRPKEAMTAGADYIVVGRPILESKAPLKTVEAILSEIA